MSGYGIRPIRWGLEAIASKQNTKKKPRSLEMWINDANSDCLDLLEKNLRQITNKRISLRISNSLAQDLLARAFFEKQTFHFVDLDCFGSPNIFLQPVIQVLQPEGILLLSSTDARSITGHDRSSAIRTSFVSARSNPSNWEIALRIQLGVIARQAWLLRRGIEPLCCFCDGRAFRIAVRINRLIPTHQESLIGILGRCQFCGAQSSQTLLSLKSWQECSCNSRKGSWLFNGPLWLGPLQEKIFISKLLALEKVHPVHIDEQSKKLFERLKLDSGLPLFSWDTNELSKNLGLKGPPPLNHLIEALRKKNFKAHQSAIMQGQLRTDAPFSQLSKICHECS